MLEEYSFRHSEKTAVFALCGMMDIPFMPEMYKKITETNPPFAFGKYIRALQIDQYRDKSFINSVAETDLSQLKQTNPTAYTTNECLNRLQENFSSLREEVRDIQAKLANDGNIRKKSSKKTFRKAEKTH